MCEKLSAILEADRSCFGIGAERQINMCNALEELRQGEVLSNFTLSNVSFVFSFKLFRLKWNFT